MTDDREALNEEVHAAWDALAGFWDERVEAGETWQRHLIQPAVERLLELRPGERVLEIACGNGEFARRMTQLGAQVLATDFSERMLERARAHGGDIEYRSTDATDEAALLALGHPGSLDAVVSNMAIMDMTTIDPMVSAGAQLLKRGGRFVFSTLHPAFNSGEVTPTIEQVYRDGELTEVYSVRVSAYGRASMGKGVAIPGQPIAQWYFHRSISAIFQVFFDHGFSLDGMEEPLVDPERGKPSTPGYVFTEVPGVLVARMRLLA